MQSFKGHQNFHVDMETFSEIELSDVGAYRYAEDASTEILMLAIAKGNDEPMLWISPRWRNAVPGLHDIESEGLISELRDNPDALVYAHNAQFERAMTMFCDSPVAFMRERPKQWRCTAAMARRAAIPDSLEKCGEYLDLDAKKDSRGKTLIRKFSILQTAGKRKGQRILPTDEPDAFKEFGQYCLQDVRTEQAIHRALTLFELKGPSILDTFLLDIHLNDRGIPVNVPALRNARAIVDELMADRGAEFRALTKLEPTQREAVKGWLAAKGVPLEDMQGDTLAQKITELEAVEADPLEPSDKNRTEALQCLRLYSELRFAAVKKVHTMLDCANADGRVRGTLLYHGAGTGRWSGRGMQPQNFKKPTIKHLKGAFEMLEKGCTAEDLDLLYGQPLEVISSCIRNFITATLDADYASIEARILPWVAGQEDALQRFRRGEDSYIAMAGVIYNKKPKDVTPDERQLGKAAILGAGYGMGASKFQATCEMKGITITPELAKRAIDAFRAAHPKVKSFWYDCDDAARRALAQPNRSFSAGDFVSFQCRIVAGKKFLFCRLPSGREIAYAEPKIEVDPRETEDRRNAKNGWFDEPRENVTYLGQIPGKAFWGRVKMYGGKWVENCLSGETLILSETRGWIRLDDLGDDRVWDGAEFVSHEGLLPRGMQKVIDVHGVLATPEHLFLSNTGDWFPAEIACHHKSMVLWYGCEPKNILQAPPLSAVKSDRANFRPSDSSAPSRIKRQDAVGSAVSMRQDQDQGGLRVDEARPQGLRLRLLPDETSVSDSEQHPRTEQAPGLSGLVFDETSVSIANASGVAQLRWAGDNRLPSLAGVLQELLGGHGADLAEGAGLRPHKQQRGILPRELPLGDLQDQCSQSSSCSCEPRASGISGLARGQIDNAAIPYNARLESNAGLHDDAQRVKSVYDIRNCGPRHRFAVKSPTTGAVLIAHNCVQAIAADIMAHGANNVVLAGYDAFTLIHDQLLASYKSGQTVEEFTALLTTLPPWAAGLPLKAEGKRCPYYSK